MKQTYTPTERAEAMWQLWSEPADGASEEKAIAIAKPFRATAEDAEARRYMHPAMDGRPVVLSQIGASPKSTLISNAEPGGSGRSRSAATPRGRRGRSRALSLWPAGGGLSQTNVANRSSLKDFIGNIVSITYNGMPS